MKNTVHSLKVATTCLKSWGRIWLFVPGLLELNPGSWRSLAALRAKGRLLDGYGRAGWLPVPNP